MSSTFTSLPATAAPTGEEQFAAMGGWKTLELMIEWHQQVPCVELVILRDCYDAAHRENAPAWNAAVQAFPIRHGL